MSVDDLIAAHALEEATIESQTAEGPLRAVVADSRFSGHGEDRETELMDAMERERARVMSLYAGLPPQVRQMPKALSATVTGEKANVTLDGVVDQNGAAFKKLGFRGVPGAMFFNSGGLLTCVVTASLSEKQLDNEASAAVEGWSP